MENHQMRPALRQKLSELRAARSFDASSWISSRAASLNAYLASCGVSSVVVGVSGGIDSAATVALCHHAMKLPGSPLRRVVGLMLPMTVKAENAQNSSPATAAAYDRAAALAPFCDLFRLDMGDVYKSLESGMGSVLKLQSTQLARGNLQSALRTPALYYAAQLTGSLVVGTGNCDEDGFLYYFTKAGDGISDIQLIHDLHKSEVYKIAEELKIPKELLTAQPSADLWPGQTDASEIGWGYDFVELITELAAVEGLDGFSGQLDGEDAQQFAAARGRLFYIHNNNKHKEHYPLNLK